MNTKENDVELLMYLEMIEKKLQEANDEGGESNNE